MNIALPGKSSATYYDVFDDGGDTPKYFNQLSGAYETYNASNWTATKYCVATTLVGLKYVSVVPTAAAGGNVTRYLQLGGSPTVTDLPTVSGSVADASGLAAAELSSVKTQTDKLQFDGDGNVQANAALIDGEHPSNTEGKLWVLNEEGNPVASDASLLSLAGIFSGITSLAKWLAAGFQARPPDEITIEEINAIGSGTDYAPATDSQQAIAANGGGGGDVILAADQSFNNTGQTTPPPQPPTLTNS